MLDPKWLDDMSARLAGLVPPSARELQRDLEKNLRVALSAGLSRLDLVTREELEVQAAVLARTRARLQTLEQRIAELEQTTGVGVVGATPGEIAEPPAQEATADR